MLFLELECSVIGTVLKCQVRSGQLILILYQPVFCYQLSVEISNHIRASVSYNSNKRAFTIIVLKMYSLLL